jgi:hypothetical protein
MKDISKGIQDVNNKLANHVEQSQSNYRTMQINMKKFAEATGMQHGNSIILGRLLNEVINESKSL